MKFIGSGFTLWDQVLCEGDAEGSSSAGGGGAYGQQGLNDAAASVSGGGRGPSPSSPAGGAQAASGGPGSTSYGPSPSSSPSYGGGGRAGGVGTEGAGGGFYSPADPSPSVSSTGGGGRAGGVGTEGVGGGFHSPSAPAGTVYSPASYSPSPSPFTGPVAGGGWTDPGSTDYGRGLFAAAAATPTGFAPANTLGGVQYAATPTGFAPTGFTAPSVSARQAETQSLNSLFNYGNEVKSVIAAGRGWTTVQLNNGTVETRSGARGSRNNNPGNIEYNAWSRSKGAVGTDGRFAVFPSVEVGRKAMETLVFGPTYAGRTIEGAISRYAPSHENNSKAYANTIAAAAGVPTSTVVGTLTPDQRSALIGAMISVEGSTRGYRSETVTPGQSWGVPSGQSTPPTAVANVSLPSFGPVPDSRPSPTVATSTDPFADKYLSPGFTPPSNFSVPSSTGSRPSSVPDEIDGVPTNTTRSITFTAPVPSDLPSTLPPFTPVSPLPAAPLGVVTRGDLADVAPEQKGSLGGKVASTAIDIGLGMIPGVGLGAGLFNAGAALTGNKTLGERAMDMFQNAPGPTGKQNVTENDGAGQDWRERAGKAEGDAETEAATPAEDFERKYLYVRDLPTPQQRWGRVA